MATSRISRLDDSDRPLSLNSTPDFTPQKATALGDRQRNPVTEISEPIQHLVFPTPEGSQVDDRDIARLSSVSGLSEYPSRSALNVNAKPLPSPPATKSGRLPSLSTEFEKSVEKNISSPVAVHDSLGFTFRRPDPTSPSMKGVTSPRQSMFIENLGSLEDDKQRPAASREINKNTVPGIDWPLRSPTASPAPEKGTSEMETISESGGSKMATKEPKQNPTIISPQARKAAKLNLLPKFLRTKDAGVGDTNHISNIGKGVDQPEAVIAVETGDKSSPGKAVSPKSFFDDESSDGGEDSQIESAQRAVIASPVMVKHGSATRVGLKEMLSTTPPASEDGTGPSKTKALRLLGEDTNSHDPTKEIPRGIYKHQDAGASKAGSIGMGLWKEMNPFAPGTAHKSTPSPEVPTPIPTPSPAPKASRKVSFPSPPPLDVQPGHRFLRQSIVSTPYPPDDQPGQKRAMQIPSTVFSDDARGDHGPESMLALLVYSNSSPTPLVKKIVVPNPKETTLADNGGEKISQRGQEMTSDFDDEKLFKLIRKEYASMKGTFKHFTSARTARSIKILSYQSSSQLIAKSAKLVHLQFDEGDGITPEARIQSLFEKPKAGRKHHEWTHWIHSQPENNKETSTPTADKLAFEIIESWSPSRLYLAVTAVFISSIATTLLWIFLGTGGGNTALNAAFSTFAHLTEGKAAYKGAGAGERVGGGAVLGLLVLFLGWTGVAGWLLLSWLVM